MEDVPVNRSATLDATWAPARARAAGEENVDRERSLDRFLAGIERIASRIAAVAVGGLRHAERPPSTLA